MKYYFIASIKINDQDKYREYQRQAREIAKLFKGTYITIDDQPDVLEGTWGYSKIVIIEFPSKEEHDRWYHSPEYQSIVNLRLEATLSDSIIARGFC
ncbi:MAG TPA: DUF1330 domain-containing protein [Spirochaetota bacterium]